MIPARLTSPTVGLIPTIPFADEGHTIDPSVSDPTAAAHKLAATAAPEPELDPHALRSNAYGLCVCPPRPLHPLDECDDRKFAHSLRFVFPSNSAPDSRSRRAAPESFGGVNPSSASDPAVVVIRSAVPMLSLIRIGTPCSGPRGPFDFLSASSASASASASGFSSITEFNAGPFVSISPIRPRYFSANSRDVYFPDCNPAERSASETSSSSNAFTAPAASCAGTAAPRARAIVGAASEAAPTVNPDFRNRLRSGRRGAFPFLSVGIIRELYQRQPTTAYDSL